MLTVVLALNPMEVHVERVECAHVVRPCGCITAEIAEAFLLALNVSDRPSVAVDWL